MRFRVHIKTDELPVAYRHLFLSLIKEAVMRGDEDLYQELYKGREGLPKRYSFAVFLHHFKKEQKIFKVERTSLSISSSDLRIIAALLNGFQDIKEFTYRKWTLLVERIEILKEKQIKGSVVRFKTLSPILLEDKQKKPLLINDPAFEHEMNFVMNQQFQSQYGRGLKKPLKILEFQMKRQVVQETNSKANGQIFYYTGLKGTFTVYGNPDDLELIYKDGAMKRKSQGFGLLDVVEVLSGE